MALTQIQEQALLDMLQKWTGAQERRPTKPASLNEAVARPGIGWHVMAYDASNSNKNLFRAPLNSVGYSLSTNSLNIPVGGAINWDNANHLVSSKQLKGFYEGTLNPVLSKHTTDITAARSVADGAMTYAQNLHSTVNSNSSEIAKNATAISKLPKGWADGLVMDFGGLPSVTGASTVSFNRRFKGVPIVIVNFWGDVGNPRFSLAQTSNETWGIRLSATYPGVWAVIGEPA